MKLSPELLMALAQHLGWTLLHSLWHGAVVGLALVCVLRLFARRSASLRHGACMLAMALLGLLTVATFLRSQPIATPLPQAAMNVEVKIEEAMSGAARDPVASISTTPIASFHWRQTLEPLLPWIAAAWCLGIAALSTTRILALLTLQRWRKRGVAARLGLQDIFTRLEERFGVLGGVCLLESADAAAPMLAGILRPVVLLPLRVVSGLGEREIEAILAHELAHFVRHDAWFNMAQIAFETLYFYHPVIWWIGRRARDERENAADDLALELCEDRRVYAGALGHLAALKSTWAVAANGGSLLGRIRRILKPVDAMPSAWSASVPAFLSLLGVFLLVHAQAQIAPRAASPEKVEAPKTEASGTISKKVAELEKKVASLEEEKSKEARLAEMLAKNKQAARLRAQEDGRRYNQEQLKEIETLYQVANTKGKRSEEARESLNQLLERYDGANRTGCALLYLGQASEGEKRIEYLTRAVEKFSDCYYFDGCQVGGYARYVLALTLWDNGEKEKARKLFEEIRTTYKEATDHRGRPMPELVDAAEKELEKSTS